MLKSLLWLFNFLVDGLLLSLCTDAKKLQGSSHTTKDY